MGLEPAVAFIGASSESPIGNSQMMQSNPTEPYSLADELVMLSCLVNRLQLYVQNLALLNMQQDCGPMPRQRMCTHSCIALSSSMDGSTTMQSQTSQAKTHPAG